MPVFDADDFGISPTWEGDVVRVTHFNVADDLRGQKIGSAILETVKRVYFYEGAEKLVVRMGGGEAAIDFLEANEFTVTKTEDVDDEGEFAVEGESIVTAEYVY